MASPGADSLKNLNFLSITVFREFQGWEKLIILSITVFRGFEPHKTLGAHNNQLSPTSILTKREHSSVSLPKRHKHPKIPTLKLTKHCSA